MRTLTILAVLFAALAGPAAAQDNYETWPVLKSTFPSTGGDGSMIKGYDPVIVGSRCVTTFMAHEPSGAVYFNIAEFTAVPAQGGTLCTDGKWRAFDNSASGTTPFRVFSRTEFFAARRCERQPRIPPSAMCVVAVTKLDMSLAR